MTSAMTAGALWFVFLFLTSVARAEVSVSRLFSDHMVLQRGKPIPVFGRAAPQESVVVLFHGQRAATTASAQGEWQLTLKAMPADPVGQTLTVTGKNTVRIEDVLLGDVWLCSGQSNMAFNLGSCGRPGDLAAASFPGVRQFAVPLSFAATPSTTLQGSWAVCTPRTASGFSATAFYFARKLYQETSIPQGLIVSSVGGTRIDLWLAPEGLMGLPVLHPLLSQKVLPSGPFSLFNGMIFPLAPYGIKGVLWYQGENSELTVQSRESYYLKMKALVQGWQRLWGIADLAFYFVQLANWGELPKSVAPELTPGRGWDADTRLQQTNALALPHAGMASALDIGESQDMHPKDKLDLGERLALWALKNDYGRSELITCGPVLKDVTVLGSAVLCSFDGIGHGLMVGAKDPYQPTREVPGGTLERFVIAGAEGVWYPAQAQLRGTQVVLRSPSVAVPRRIAYACWQNPIGANLYNRDGLPAAPFYVEDVRAHYTITATAGKGGRISSAGVRSMLPRATALYTITPEVGYAIQDVRVDGTSVGAVSTYTFDPIFANHTITATFTRSRPRYEVRASATGGGTLSPSGSLTVAQGDAQAFRIQPDPGNLVDVRVDGVSLGARSQLTLHDLRASHQVEVVFSPTLKTVAGFGGTLSHEGLLPVRYGSDQTITIMPSAGFLVERVFVDGQDRGPLRRYTFTKTTTAHTLRAVFKPAAPLKPGSVPRPEQLIFASAPESRALRPIGSPKTERIGGTDFTQLVYERGEGFTVGSYTQPIPCEGATIVVVAKPVRNGANAAWTSLVDVFYDRLVLGIRNDTGAVCVRRNGSLESSLTPIPEGQTTLLSLVVQPNGTYKAFANGAEVLSSTTTSALTALVPGVAGPYANSITLGRNAPDGWTAFNGYLGDAYFYKVALTDTERQELEAYLSGKLLRTDN